MNVFTTTPTLEGEHDTKAWKIEIASLPDPLACIGYWIVRAPWAHPMWHSHLLTMVHLREHPGLPTPHKVSPAMTHECLIYALHPDYPCDPQAGKLCLLEPVSVAVQMVRNNDDEATSWLADRVAEIVRCELSPDSDFRKAWRIKAEDPTAKLSYRPFVKLHLPSDEQQTRH